MATTGNAKRCKANNRRGQPCGAYAGQGSAYCFWHDPKRAAARQAARARGGQARHGRRLGGGEPVELATVGDVLPILALAIGDVLTLEKSIARARAIGYLCSVAIKTLELSDLAERVKLLEQTLGGETP